MNNTVRNCIAFVNVELMEELAHHVQALLGPSKQWHSIKEFKEQREVFVNLAVINNISRSRFFFHLQSNEAKEKGLPIDFSESIPIIHQEAQHARLVNAVQAYQMEKGTLAPLTFIE